MTRFHLFAVALLLLLTPLLMAPSCSGGSAGQTQAPPPATLEALLCDYGSNPLGIGQPPSGAPLFVCEVDAEEYKVPGCECPPGVVIPGLLVALEGALPEPADIQKIADDCLEAAIRFKYQLPEEQYSVIVYCDFQGYYSQGPGGPQSVSGGAQKKLQSFVWDVLEYWMVYERVLRKRKVEESAGVGMSQEPDDLLRMADQRAHRAEEKK